MGVGVVLAEGITSVFPCDIQTAKPIKDHDGSSCNNIKSKRVIIQSAAWEKSKVNNREKISRADALYKMECVRRIITQKCDKIAGSGS